MSTPATKTDKVRLFLVDDHPLVLEGLRRLLETDERVTVVGEARSAEEGLDQLQTLEADVKVMVADDEEGVLALVNASLRADGDYEMFLARDGDEAVSVAQKERPDLLILDVLMPKKDGY